MSAIPRFDGAAAWATLSPERQAEIGALALELGVAFIGGDVEMETAGPALLGPQLRALAASFDFLRQELVDEAAQFIPAEPRMPPVPSLLGPICRVCGCSQDDACDGGCDWAEPDLCSACEP